MGHALLHEWRLRSFSLYACYVLYSLCVVDPQSGSMFRSMGVRPVEFLVTLFPIVIPPYMTVHIIPFMTSLKESTFRDSILQ